MKYICIRMKTTRIFFLATAMFFATMASLAQDIKWQVDNTVYSSVMLGNTLYLGGSFTYIGKFTGTAVVIPEATGNAPDPTIPKLNVSGLLPSISSIIPDGQNGYFVAGSISYFDGSPLSPSGQILHIQQDIYGNKFLHWSARTNGRVNCLYLQGSTLYAGGVFSSATGSLGTLTRRNIAAFNIADGSVTSWNPVFASAGAGVFSITGSGSVVYVGGGLTFGSFVNLTAINTSTGVSAWSVPNNPNNTVRALAVSGSTLFVGGDFSSAGSLARKEVAAVNIADGSTITGFDAGTTAPGGTNAIRSFAVSADGATLYIGGSFFNFQSRNNLIALNAATGIATGWNPNPTSAVNSIAISGNRIYVAGTFNSSSGATTIGGQSRNYIAAINTATGFDDNSWVTLLNGIVNYVSVAGSNVYLGGEFTSVGGARRNRAAAIDYSNGTILPWDPNANSNVMALIAYNGSIYVGGDFTSIGGQARQRIASLDMMNGTANAAWSANANATVRTLYGTNGNIYAGGDFTSVGGQARNRIAKLRADNGAVDATWNPGADNIVRAISGYQEKIFAGGDFDNIGGQPRSKIAALDSNGSGAAITAWYPPAGAAGTTSAVPCRVNALAVRSGIIYAGGSFASMGGQNKKNIAAIDNSGAIVMGFTANPNSANEVNVILPSGNYLYVGGSFNDMKTNTQHQDLSEIDPATGDPSVSFFASPGAAVYTIGVNLFTMYFGGAFPNYIPEFSFPVARNSYLSYHTANGGMTVLPVEIRNFNVQQQNNERIIRWQANQETTEDRWYEVQRASVNFDYTTIYRQPADKAVDESYEIKDIDHLPAGMYYYRLKISEAGKTVYSPVRSITLSGNSQAQVFPSVVSGGNFSVVAASRNDIIRLFDNGGRLMGTYSLQPGLNSISTGHLSKGIYHYMITGEKEVSSGKIVIQ